MTDTALIRTLTLQTLEHVAPEEVFLLDYYPAADKDFGTVSGGPQGFGAETAIALTLPFLIKFFEKFIEKMSSNTADSVYKKVAKYLSTERQNPDPDVAAAIVEELVATGFTSARAREISNAVLLSLEKHKDKLSQK